MLRLGEVAFDGTRVKANNSRYNTRTTKTLEEKLKALNEQFERLMAEAQAFDTEQEGPGSPTKLPDDLTDMQRRRAQILAALEQAKAADEARRQQGIDPVKKPPQVPMADPESQWNALPRNSHKKLIKSCFVYARRAGSVLLPKEKSKPDQRGGVKVTLTVYRCAACAACAWVAACQGDNNKHGRTITRESTKTRASGRRPE